MASSSVPRIPPELPNIMKDLTKEILRENPANIYMFAAAYFESLIRKRDGHLNKNYERFSCPPITSKSLDVQEKTCAKADLRRGRSTGSQKSAEMRRRTKTTIQTFEPSTSISSNTKKINNKSSNRKLSSNDLVTNRKYNEPRPSINIGGGGTRKIIEATSFDELTEESGDVDGRWLLNRAAIKIQRYVKRFLERKRLRDAHTLKVADSGFLDENAVKEAQSRNDAPHDSPTKDDSLLSGTTYNLQMLTAALTIQRVIRGYLARKKYKSMLEKKIQEAVVVQADDEFNEFEEFGDTFEFTEELESAAVSIQKVYRGFQVRKELKEKFDKAAKKILEQLQEDQIDTMDAAAMKILKKKELDEVSNEEESKVEPNEEELAATKIQATYRGHKTREELKQVYTGKVETSQNNVKKDETSDTNNPTLDNDLEQAAIKIQASYRGFKTREELKQVGIKGDDDTLGEGKDMEGIPESKEDAQELQHAAVTIQKNYKGYKTRKELKDQHDKSGNIETKDEDPDVDQTKDTEALKLPKQDEEAENAAISIQKHYKGYKTRKDLQKKDVDDDTELKQDENDSKQDNSDVQESTVLTIQENKVEKELQDDSNPVETEVDPNKDLKKKEIDIDLTDPEVEQAAQKIQAGFRGLKTRKELKEKKENTTSGEDDSNKEPNIKDDAPQPVDEEEFAAVTIQKNYKGYKTRKELKEKITIEPINDNSNKPPPKEEEIDIDLNDPEVAEAAKKIQASFRGHQVRMKRSSDTTNTDSSKDDTKVTDPELDQAATKIQAGFRGHKTREELKQKMKVDEVNEPVKEPKLTKETTFDAENEDAQNAAITIQKNYKGYKTRKELRQSLSTTSSQTKSHRSATPDESKYVIQHATAPKEVSFDIENPKKEEVSAALRIQRIYRKYRIDKELRELKISLRAVPVLDLSDPVMVAQMTEAATNIQRFFRKKRKVIESSSGESDANNVVDQKPTEEKIHHQDSDTHVSETLLAALETDPHHIAADTLDDADEKVIELSVHQEPEKSNQSSTPRNDSFEHVEPEPEDVKPRTLIVQLPIETVSSPYKNNLSSPGTDLETGEKLTGCHSDDVKLTVTDIFLNQSDEQKDQNKTDEMKLKSVETLAPVREDDDKMSIDSLTVENRHDQTQEPYDDSLESIASQSLLNEALNEKILKNDEKEVDEPICVEKRMYKCPESEVKDVKDETLNLDKPKSTKVETAAHVTDVPKIDDAKDIKDEVKDEVKDVKDKNMLSDKILENEEKEVDEPICVEKRMYKCPETDVKDAKDEMMNVDKPESSKVETAAHASDVPKTDDVKDIKVEEAKPNPEIKEEHQPIEPSSVKMDETVPDINKNDKTVKLESKSSDASSVNKQDVDTEVAKILIDHDIINEEKVLPVIISVPKTEQEKVESKPTKTVEEEIDIDLKDPEVEQAAKLIQASFRGSKFGKKSKIDSNTSKSTNSGEEKVKEEIKSQVTNVDDEVKSENVKNPDKIEPSQDLSKPESKPDEEKVEPKIDVKPAEEEIDIDLEDPEVEQAAKLIQASFRGSKFGRKSKTDSSKSKSGPEENSGDEKVKQEIINETDSKNINSEADKIEPSQDLTNSDKQEDKIPVESKPVEERKEPESDSKKAEEEIDIDLEDPEVEQAAKLIQASFRGSKFGKKSKNSGSSNEKKSDEKLTQETDVTKDVPTSTNDVSSTKLVQEEPKVSSGIGNEEQKDEVNLEVKHDEEEIDIDLKDPEVENAAKLIQASFRGSKLGKKSKKSSDPSTSSGDDRKVTQERKSASKDFNSKIPISTRNIKARTVSQDSTKDRVTKSGTLKKATSDAVKAGDGIVMKPLVVVEPILQKDEMSSDVKNETTSDSDIKPDDVGSDAPLSNEGSSGGDHPAPKNSPNSLTDDALESSYNYKDTVPDTTTTTTTTTTSSVDDDSRTEVDEPLCVQKFVYKTPEMEDEVSEIVNFDTSTHDKSLVEEEYYSLKKKELQLDSRVSSTGSYSSGVFPKSTTTTNGSSSSKQGSSSSAKDDSTDLDQVPETFETRRTTTMDSDEIVWGKIADSDSSAPSTATDRTVIHRESPRQDILTPEPRLLEDYKEIPRPTTSRGLGQLSKELNKTFSTESDDVVVGTIPEKLNETFIVHKSPRKDGSELNKTFIIDKRLDTGATTADSDDVVVGHINKDGNQLIEPSSSVTSKDKSFNDDEHLDELKALSDAPPRRRLYSSMSVVQPPTDSDAFNPFQQTTIYQQQYLDKIHGQSLSDTNDTAYGSDRDFEDEDQFDDFYPGNIRQKIMASSFSIADSDYFDPHKPVESNEDTIVTALETITSTDSESTTASASTKVANNAARRVLPDSKYSIGNAAITESLDEFVEKHELANMSEGRDRIATLQKKITRGTRGRFKRNALTEDVPSQASIDEEGNYDGQIIQIKLEQKSTDSNHEKSGSESSSEDTRAAFRNKKMSYYSLNVDKYDTAARRSLLHRENAFQKNSTPDDDLSAKSVSTENDKKRDGDTTAPVGGEEDSEKEKTDAEDVEEDEVQANDATKPDDVEQKEQDVSQRNEGSTQDPDTNPEKPKPNSAPVVQNQGEDVRFPLLSIMRQRTLPVQIDTSIMRILPKHVVKRIKSANNNGSTQPKRKFK